MATKKPKSDEKCIAFTPKSVDYEKAASKLASCVLFALKFLKAPGSGTMHGQLWQTEFMDALDMVGYEIDREKYFDRK